MRTSPITPTGDCLTGLQSQEIANALHSGIAINAGVLGKQLFGMKIAGRIASDHIGEGAAAIDPEVPSAFSHDYRRP
jgi:hypothetical protein